MVFGPATDEAEMITGHPISQRLRVADDLLLIRLEGRLQRFLETNGFCGDDVHPRSALDSGENIRLDVFREFFAAHDQTTARSAQSFVCGRGDKISIRERARMYSGGNQACDMRDVCEKIGT